MNITEVINVTLAPITILIGYLHLKIIGIKKDQDQLRDKLSEAYTKQETKEIIALMTDPIKDTTDRLIHSQEELVKALSRLEIQLAKYAK